MSRHTILRAGCILTVSLFGVISLSPGADPVVVPPDNSRRIENLHREINDLHDRMVDLRQQADGSATQRRESLSKATEAQQEAAKQRADLQAKRAQAGEAKRKLTEAADVLQKAELSARQEMEASSEFQLLVTEAAAAAAQLETARAKIKTDLQTNPEYQNLQRQWEERKNAVDKAKSAGDPGAAEMTTRMLDLETQMGNLEKKALAADAGAMAAGQRQAKASKLLGDARAAQAAKLKEHPDWRKAFESFQDVKTKMTQGQKELDEAQKIMTKMEQESRKHQEIAGKLQREQDRSARELKNMDYLYKLKQDELRRLQAGAPK